MRCRRCDSIWVFRLSLLYPQDNPIFRCRDCGLLFSPGDLARDEDAAGAPPEPVRESEEGRQS